MEATEKSTLDLAYELAVAIVIGGRDRIVLIEKRIQDIAGVGTAATVAAITLASGQGLAYRSPWFYGATICAVGAIVVTAWTKVAWRSSYIDMTKVEALLNDDSSHFKRSIIHATASSQKVNSKIGTAITYSARLVLALYALEAILFALWAYRL